MSESSILISKRIARKVAARRFEDSFEPAHYMIDFDVVVDGAIVFTSSVSMGFDPGPDDNRFISAATMLYESSKQIDDNTNID